MANGIRQALGAFLGGVGTGLQQQRQQRQQLQQKLSLEDLLSKRKLERQKEQFKSIQEFLKPGFKGKVSTRIGPITITSPEPETEAQKKRLGLAQDEAGRSQKRLEIHR